MSQTPGTGINPPGGGGQHSPAAARNLAPITDILRDWLPDTGLIAEIASGTGQHLCHLASEYPALNWQPSEADPDRLAILAAAVNEVQLTNLAAPLGLDVLQSPWPLPDIDGLININMLHISAPTTVSALFKGAAMHLKAGGWLFLYGPFIHQGRFTSDSNRAFDADLKSRNADWGLREIDEVIDSAH